ncbi:hypothetical protein ACFLVU_01565 [Chloroflexota bacterium]
MIKKKEVGQAFVLVLIFLAVGALMVVPALRLTGTLLQSSQSITQRNTDIYACEAAQEKIMWMLYNGDLMDILSTPNSTANFTVDVCGTIVYCGVVMRAVELGGGTTLVTDHTIMSMKTVEPNEVEDPGITTGGFTYTIAFEQVSVNNTSSLLAVYDILPIDFGKNFNSVYVLGSSEISENGITWEYIPDPSYGTAGQQMRLEWVGETYFSPDFGHFDVGEVKYLRFRVRDTLITDDNFNCNRVVTKVGDIFTISDPCTLTVGSPDPSEGCDDGVFSVIKSSYPTIIPPMISTDVTYTITVTNEDGFARHISQIDDYLPPGFVYTDNSTAGPITSANPSISLFTKDGIDRWHLTWDEDILGGAVLIGASEELTLTFVAVAEQGISGTYYNEVLVQPASLSTMQIYTDIDPSLSIYDLLGDIYSWNTGTVIVPAYDASTGTGSENITTNIGVGPDGASIFSWHVE